jgi:hypothetical protein
MISSEYHQAMMREKKYRRVPTSQEEYNARRFLRKVIYRALTAEVKGDLLMLQCADTFISVVSDLGDPGSLCNCRRRRQPWMYLSNA